MFFPSGLINDAIGIILCIEGTAKETFRMAEFTKQALAGSLTSLLRVKRLDKITIQEIVDGADVNRQTFYYHFSDIFDLTRYMIISQYRNLLKQNGIDGIILDPDPLSMFLDIMMENKQIALNIYKGMDEAHLRRSLHEVVDPEIEEEVRNIANGRLSLSDIKFAVAFYSSGYYGVFLEWLKDDLQPAYRRRMESILPLMEESLVLLVEKLVARRNF